MGGAGILIPQGNAGWGFLLISRLVDEIARGWSRGGDRVGLGWSQAGARVERGRMVKI